jgi:hypothetical protein
MNKNRLVFGIMLAVVSIILGTSQLTTAVYAQSPSQQNMTATTMNTTTPITTNTTATNATNATPAARGATNATNATATTSNTTIITTLVWNPGDEPEIIGGAEFGGPEISLGGERVIQLIPQNIQYQQTDPAFAKLAQTTADCVNELNPILERIDASGQGDAAITSEDIQSVDLCADVIRQGIDQFCESTDFATFDIQSVKKPER